MQLYEITFQATVTERVTVAAANEDDAHDVAERIVRAGYTPHSELDWEAIEWAIGSEHDLPEREP
jgi:hypothetical protein